MFCMCIYVVKWSIFAKTEWNKAKSCFHEKLKEVRDLIENKHFV